MVAGKGRYRVYFTVCEEQWDPLLGEEHCTYELCRQSKKEEEEENSLAGAVGVASRRRGSD